jgi:hypothetical protein
VAKRIDKLEKKLILNTFITFFLAIVIFLIQSVFLNFSSLLLRNPWALFILSWDLSVFFNVRIYLKLSVFFNVRIYLKEWDEAWRMRRL